MLCRSRSPAAFARPVVAASAILALALAGGGASIADESPSDDEGKPPRSITSNLGPRTSLHGFAHVTFGAERGETPEGETESKNAFALGEFDLYFTSQLTQSVSFLGETVIEFEEGGKTRIDVERLFIKWALSDPLWVSLGRRHTPLGYWNETFHHGFILQPTVSRPLVLRFEDEDGILPIHTVGAMAGGRVFSGRWIFDYIGGVSNGRGLTRLEIQNTGDVNQQKATFGKMSFIREGRGSFQFGPMVYFDDIAPDPEIPGREDALSEAILGGHFVYHDRYVGLLAEYYGVEHEDQVTGEVYDSSGGYAIAYTRLWKWNPYVGYDDLRVDAADPYYSGIVPREKRYLAGVRLDPNPFTALKIEYQHWEYDETPANALFVQVDWTF